jgi:hypothetical protein
MQHVLRVGQMPLQPRVVQAAHRPNPGLCLGPQPLLRLPLGQYTPNASQDTDWVIIAPERGQDAA